MRFLPTALISALTAAFTVAVLSFAQAPPTCPYGATWNGSVFACNPTPLIPPGLIPLVLTACPTGWTEVSALNGRVLRGTVAANLDVATSGGSDTVTPTGTVAAPVFTGNPVTVPAQTTLFVSAAGVVLALTTQTSFGAIPWTASGTNTAPAFTGTAADSRPAFTRVIACQKT